MKLFTLAAFIATASAFADTAAFFSSLQIDATGPHYITKSGDLSAAFNLFTEEFCLQPKEKLVVYRVEKLERKQPVLGGSKSTFFKHVHYQSESELDLSIAEGCSVLYTKKLPSNLNEVSENIIVVDLEGSEPHSIDEFLGDGHVVVQGKPGFQTAGSRGESIKEFLGDKLHIDFSLHSKKDLGVSEDLADLDSFRNEIDNDFETAKALIADQESDSSVHILTDDSGKKESFGSSKNATSTRSNLFTHYQFFTPGMWSVLIVCSFLLFVCITAVNWITSIDLSYKSFDKQIEYEKKTE